VLTSQITGQIDWRRDGIRYRKNEVYIDVLESVNILMSATGAVLRSDVTGQIVMKALLSGWPECKFGLNDKLIMDREAASKAAAAGGGGGGGHHHHHTRRNAGVEIDDCTFHRCVRLGKFDADRTITFIPPDGEFELMRYRVTENVNLPFRLIPVIQVQCHRLGVVVGVGGVDGRWHMVTAAATTRTPRPTFKYPTHDPTHTSVSGGGPKPRGGEREGARELLLQALRAERGDQGPRAHQHGQDDHQCLDGPRALRAGAPRHRLAHQALPGGVRVHDHGGRDAHALHQPEGLEPPAHSGTGIGD
jgi:hypothetical protein